MKRLVTLVGVLTAFFIVAAPAQASFFGVKCHAGQDAQVDPIGQPGVAPSAHLHTFYGAQGVTANSTVASMEASPTNCYGGAFAPGSTQVAMTATQVAADTSGLWTPKMYVNGTPTNPTFVTEYWSKTGQANPNFTNVPEGLQMVAGNAHATGPPPMYELYFDCTSSTQPASPTPTGCAVGHGLQAHIIMPGCWDGVGLRPSDVTYSGAPVPFTQFPHAYPCPAAFPVQLPRIQMIFHTNLSGDQRQHLTFSSGPWYTLHADYWQTWKNQLILAADEQFLRTGVIPH
jgi:hypothetical protein